MIPPVDSEQTLVVNVRWAEESARTEEVDPRESFFRAHAQEVYAYAMRRVGNAVAAEDIAADVFLEAVRFAKQRSGSDPLPWLYGIARRKVADHHRLSARRKTQSLTTLIPAKSEDPHDAAEASARNSELRQLVDLLPADQKEALLLQCVEGLSAQQIATSMQKSIPAINSLLQRARQTLRQKSGETR